MEIVSEVGLEGFSMRLLCERVQLNAPLVYAIFPSKDELLYRCFLFVNRQIAGLFEGVSLSADRSVEEIKEYIHAAWLRYFYFMVRNGSRTLFYYIYRDSNNLQRILISNNETVAQDMTDFLGVIGVVAEKLGLFRELYPDYFYVFLLDGTGNFVRRAIRGDVSLSEQEVDQIWRLLTRGLFGFGAG